MFDLKLLDEIHLERKETEDGRLYVHPQTQEEFESVTTILKKYTDQSFLETWKKRVGEEEANRISEEAAENGSQFHNLLENYILGTKKKVDVSPFLKHSFSQIKPKLEQNVSLVYGVEHRLYSRKLKAAGTADLICKWNGIPTVVDFKTSKKDKMEEWIPHYFIQASVYAIMVYELYNILIPQIVILMAVNMDKPIVFKKNVKEFIPMIKDIFINKRRKNEFND